jgi:hypothetical protein
LEDKVKLALKVFRVFKVFKGRLELLELLELLARKESLEILPLPASSIFPTRNRLEDQWLPTLRWYTLTASGRTKHLLLPRLTLHTRSTTLPM